MQELGAWALATFKRGSYLGDAGAHAMENPDDVDDGDELALTSAREGFIVAGGHVEATTFTKVVVSSFHGETRAEREASANALSLATLRANSERRAD